MSTEVKNIIVALKARMDGAYKRTLDAGASAVSSLTSKAAVAVKGFAVAGAATVAAGAAAAAAISAMVLKVSGGMDATGKLADRLGMTTQALVGLQHAAKLAGVSDLSGALEGWNKRLGEALGGTGTAADALKILGIAAKDIAQLPMDAQVLKLADALAKVENPAQRAALSADLFGRSAGAEMVTMLGEGSGAIQRSMQEAERMGLTYDRATARIAESFQDNLTRVKAAATGVATQAAAALLPWFNTVSESLVSWATRIMPQVQSAITTAFNVIVPVIDGFGVLIQTVIAAAKAVLEGLGVSASSTGELFAGVLNGLSSAFLKTFGYVGELVSIFGSTFAAVFEAGRDILAGFGITFQGTGDLIGGICDWIVNGIQWLAAGVIKAVTFIEACFVNWRDTLEIVWKGALLGGVVFYETLKHWFTVSLPAYVQWFSENWRALFTDIWNATKTIVGNMWTNLSGFFAAVWGWLKGEGWDFTWTGLLEGFESTVQALPEIAARAKTELEKSLSADIGAAQDRIGSYYQKKVEERLGKLNAGRQAAEAAAKAAEKAADSAAKQAAKAAGPAGAAAAGAGGLAAPAEQAASAAKEFGVLGRAMSISGLVAATAAGSPGEIAARKTADNTGKMATVLERMDRRASTSDAVGFSEGVE